MTIALPALKWTPSPNFSSRHGARVDLLVLHDMEGGYAGSIAWFANPRAQVSAHYCLNEDGTECTQMVDLADKAWHVCNYNPRSVGLEMAGYAKNGFPSAQVEAAAEIFAWLAHHLQIPIRHSRGGVGPGICSHWDLGQAGGGHADPSTDPAFMDKFVAMVADAAQRHDFPDLWEPEKDKKPCSLTPPEPLRLQLDLSTTAGLQGALKALGYAVAVDGLSGPETEAAVKAFQTRDGHLLADGLAGPLTKAAIELALVSLH